MQSSVSGNQHSINYLKMETTGTIKKGTTFKKENIIFLLVFLVFLSATFYFLFKNFLTAEAVGTFSSNFVTLDDAEAITGWTASTTDLTGIALNTDDIAVQGTNGI